MALISGCHVFGPYLYSEMSTMSGAIAGSYGISGVRLFSICSPKQFWVCAAYGTDI